MLDKVTVKRKIVIVVGIAIAGLLLMTVQSILQTRNDITEGRKTALRTAVQSAAAAECLKDQARDLSGAVGTLALA